MNARTAFLSLFFVTTGLALTVAGCGGGGGTRSVLPPIAAGAGPSGADSAADAALDRAVSDAHGRLTGGATYGVIEGTWVAGEPVSGHPGFSIVDGEIVSDPPEDSPPNAAPPPGGVQPQSATSVIPAAPATPSCSAVVNNVPPPCTATGPFRRVFSGPGYSYALAHVNFPATTTMPTAAPPSAGDPSPVPLNGDTGYVYFEGWPKGNPNGGNSEFGFQYSAVHNYYTPYFKTPLIHAVYLLDSEKHFVHYAAGTTATFAIAGFTVGAQSELHVAAIGTTVGTCVTVPKSPTHLCLTHYHDVDANWTPANCCILARMTTIGQTNPFKKFYDGVKFGPVTWSGVELAAVAPSPAPSSTTLPLTGNQPPWTSAGNQNWPPQLAKVVAAGVTATGETDTINLTKLPVPSLALSPSTCQKVTGPAVIKYDATAKATGLDIELGWYWYNTVGSTYDTLTVPGATLQSDGVYLGPGTTAQLNVSPKPPTDIFVTAKLYFYDATGTYTADWNGNVYSRTDAVNFC